MRSRCRLFSRATRIVRHLPSFAFVLILTSVSTPNASAGQNRQTWNQRTASSQSSKAKARRPHSSP
jgi:hypothetical protein